jgi:hypothetical protein
MLDLVPLAGAGREVTDLDRQAGLGGQALQLDRPQAHAIAVGATAAWVTVSVPSIALAWVRGQAGEPMLPCLRRLMPCIGGAYACMTLPLARSSRRRYAREIGLAGIGATGP